MDGHHPQFKIMPILFHARYCGPRYNMFIPEIIVETGKEPTAFGWKLFSVQVVYCKLNVGIKEIKIGLICCIGAGKIIILVVDCIQI